MNAEPTHWKHTVLWLEPSNCSHVTIGDMIRGTLQYKRMKENVPDYEIILKWEIVSKAILLSSVSTTNSSASANSSASTPSPSTSGIVEKTQRFLLAV